MFSLWPLAVSLRYLLSVQGMHFEVKKISTYLLFVVFCLTAYVICKLRNPLQEKFLILSVIRGWREVKGQQLNNQIYRFS